MSLRYSESIMSEADNLSIRFRTVEQTGILVVTRHDRSQDKLEIVLEGGRVKISISIGSTEKTFFVGQSLNDDIYHTLIFERRALKIRSLVDDDSPVIGKKFIVLYYLNFFFGKLIQMLAGKSYMYFVSQLQIKNDLNIPTLLSHRFSKWV